MPPGLAQDERGTVLVEFSLIMLLLAVLTFSVVEFGIAYWQWNSAEKSTQLGARWAATSDPVAAELATFDCETDLIMPGTPCSHPDAASFGTVVCSGESQSCTGEFTFATAAFDDLTARMRQVFPNITPSNVVVEYQDLRLGYAGRGAPIPAVTVRLENMTFSFITLSVLFDSPITMPDFRATLTGEDLRTAGYAPNTGT